MNEPTGWRRWLWPLRSRKAQLALTTLAAIYANELLGWEVDVEVMMTAVGLVVAWLLGIAWEDAAAKRGGDL